MNDNLKNYIKISEEINSNQVDNVFELNIRNANSIENPNKSKSNGSSDFNEMSLNVSNLDITKLIQLFKINKKALKDFFKLQIFEFRPASEIISVINEFSGIIDNDSFENLLDFCVENNHFDLLDAVIEKSKEFVLEHHIPSLFDFLSKYGNAGELNSNSNKNGSLSANTPKKNASAKKENGSERKASKDGNNVTNKLINIFKNLFEINLDSAFLIKQYKEKDFSYSQLKQLVSLLNQTINSLTEDIKNQCADQSELLKIYENMINHFTIFGLLNEVYLHKVNQAEEDYNALKREIKSLSDVVKKLKTAVEKSIADESNKKELNDIKRKINAFRNCGIQQDVIYETINL